jgi:hypothetical protein
MCGLDSTGSWQDAVLYREHGDETSISRTSGHFLTGYTLRIESLTNKKTKQTPWPLVRERTIPTERPPLVDEI